MSVDPGELVCGFETDLDGSIDPIRDLEGASSEAREEPRKRELSWSWPENDVKILRQMVADRASTREMSFFFGRSELAIQAKCRRLGLRRKPGPRSSKFTPQQDEIVTRMKQAGASNKQIGRVVGRTPRQVYERIRSLRIPDVPEKVKPRSRKQKRNERALSRFDIRRFEAKRRGRQAS